MTPDSPNATDKMTTDKKTTDPDELEHRKLEHRSARLQIIAAVLGLITTILSWLNWDTISGVASRLLGLPQPTIEAVTPARPYDASLAPTEGRAVLESARADQLRAREAAQKAVSAAREADSNATKLAAQDSTLPSGVVRRQFQSRDGTVTTYEGFLDQEGRPTGLGVTITQSSLGVQRYSGQHEGGVFRGFGVLVYNSVERYEGDFADGLPNGYGVFTFDDGARYEGGFADDNLGGFGVMFDPQGRQIFEGEFRGGEKHGRGISWSADGAKAILQSWVNGEPAP